MTARAVRLSEEHARFVQNEVDAGRYPDPEAVFAAALDRLQDDAEIEAEKEARFNRLIQEGLDDVAAGRVETVTDVTAWLDRLGRDDANDAAA